MDAFGYGRRSPEADCLVALIGLAPLHLCAGAHAVRVEVSAEEHFERGRGAGGGDAAAHRIPRALPAALLHAIPHLPQHPQRVRASAVVLRALITLL
eukprot:882826-Prorocentrum_minimum.AAC.2